MGTVTSPAAQAAKSSSVHSYVVRAMIAIRSPARSPSAISPFATARTSAAKSAALTSCQAPSASLRLRTGSAGASRALSNGISASDPRRTAGANLGTETSSTRPSGPRFFVGSTRTGPGGVVVVAGAEGGVDTCGSSFWGVGRVGAPGRPSGRYCGQGGYSSLRAGRARLSQSRTAPRSCHGFHSRRGCRSRHSSHVRTAAAAVTAHGRTAAAADAAPTAVPGSPSPPARRPRRSR